MKTVLKQGFRQSRDCKNRKPGKMLEHPAKPTATSAGVDLRSKTAVAGTISREGLNTPSETETPALQCIADEDTVRTSRDIGVSMNPVKWVEEVFPVPLKTVKQNYWIGFLMADGYIQGYPGSYVLALQTAVKDAYHVSNFAKFIGKRSKSRGKRVQALRAVSTEMDILEKHGIVPQKTGKEQIPETVTHLPAFVRGFFDGDGTVGCYNERALAVSFFCQNKEMLRSLSKIINEAVGHPQDQTIMTCGDSDCSRIGWNFGQIKGRRLYDFLYGFDGPRLHRKERIIRIFAEKPRAKAGWTLR